MAKSIYGIAMILDRPVDNLKYMNIEFPLNFIWKRIIFQKFIVPLLKYQIVLHNNSSLKLAGLLFSYRTIQPQISKTFMQKNLATGCSKYYENLNLLCPHQYNPGHVYGYQYQIPLINLNNLKLFFLRLRIWEKLLTSSSFNLSSLRQTKMKWDENLKLISTILYKPLIAINCHNH